VRRVQALGPRVEVFGFPRTTAKSLVVAADRFQPLDRRFMIYPRGSKAAKRRKAPRASESAAPVAPREPDTAAAAGAAGREAS